MCLNKKEMSCASYNRRIKKNKLLRIVQKSKTIFNVFNKQTKLKLISKQYTIIIN